MSIVTVIIAGLAICLPAGFFLAKKSFSPSLLAVPADRSVPPNGSFASPQGGETLALRNPDARERGLTQYRLPSIKTVYDMFRKVIHDHPNKQMYGQRKVIQVVEEEKEITRVVGGVPTKEKKVWKYFELSPYQWMTGKEVLDTVSALGAGLRKIGVAPKDTITIFATTSRDWMLMTHASYSQSITIATCYDTLGEDGLTFALNEGEIHTVFTNSDLLPILVKVSKKVPSLKRIIFNPSPFALYPAKDAVGTWAKEIVKPFQSQCAGITFYSIFEVEELGMANPLEPNPPQPEDLACIMYTSGSTANPKGVMITHSNIVAAVSGAYDSLIKFIPKNVVYLGYLPLAHILEFAVELVVLEAGGSVGYGSPRTLTDASVRNCLGDLRELKPSVMVGVPAVWESIRKGVLAKLRESSPVVQTVFQIALRLKWAMIQLNIPFHRILDQIVFNKIKDQTGGRLEWVLSGGAPVPKESQKFLTCAVCPVINGYGMTETCAILSFQLPNNVIPGQVGGPVHCAEIKLVDVPEMGYLATNRPHPRGEIWVRGPQVMKGYYKQTTLTNETLVPATPTEVANSSGNDWPWLQTGDIAELHPSGAFQIIDRKKNLVKLAHGEYIALEKLESIYKTSALVANMCVVADPEQSFAVAIIVPVEKEVVAIYKQVKGSVAEDSSHHIDLKTVIHEKEVTNKVFADLKAIAKKNDLKPAEILGNIYLSDVEWTPQNGLLTAAQKLKRKDIQDRYKTEIARLYGN